MRENNENLEQVQVPTPASADVIKGQIKNGEYDNAYDYCQKTDFTDEQYEDFSKSLDTYSLPEQKSEKTALSPEEYEDVQKENLYKQVDEYSVEHDPAMRFAARSNEAISENRKIIDELLDLIKTAKEQADDSRESHKWGVAVVPVLGSIYGLVKSKKFQNNLKKIEALYNQLHNGQLEVPPTLQADRISPSRGQGKQLGGIAGAIGGSIVLGPLGAIPGLITTAYGGMQSFQSFEKTGKSFDDLKQLEAELIQLRNQDDEGMDSIDQAKSEYREEAVENLRDLSAA